MRSLQIKKMVLAALFMALGLVLPFLTWQDQMIGNMFLLMHLPVLLCGTVCGWQYGAAVGFITPLLRSLWFAKPPLYPTAIGMAFELCVYGLVIALLYRWLKIALPKVVALYAALLGAMISGRIVWGAVRFLLFAVFAKGKPFTLTLFWSEGVVKAIPGILLQLALIPLLTIMLEKAGILPKETAKK